MKQIHVITLQLSTIRSSISKLLNTLTRSESDGLACNYRNNYYGDQRCVVVTDR